MTCQFCSFWGFRAPFLLNIHIIYGVKYTFSETAYEGLLNETILIKLGLTLTPVLPCDSPETNCHTFAGMALLLLKS